MGLDSNFFSPLIVMLTVLVEHCCINCTFFFKYIFGLFAFDLQVSRERQENWRGGMTCRIGVLGAGFEPGSPAAMTVASTHGAGALPTELCLTH